MSTVYSPSSTCVRRATHARFVSTPAASYLTVGSVLSLIVNLSLCLLSLSGTEDAWAEPTPSPIENKKVGTPPPQGGLDAALEEEEDLEKDLEKDLEEAQEIKDPAQETAKRLEAERRAKEPPPTPTQEELSVDSPLISDLISLDDVAKDQQRCKERRGRWITQKLIGCQIKNAKSGRWHMKREGLIIGALSFNEGKIEGPYYEAFSSGRILSMGHFKAGQKEGLWRMWYPSGQIRELQYYRGNKKHGRSFGWQKGRCIPSWRGTYRDEKKQGSWITWQDSGARESEGWYEDDLPQGIWKYYHQEGNLIRQGEMRDGLEEGEWKEWLHTGQFWREILYKNGARMGDDEEACRVAQGEWSVDYKKRTESCVKDGFQTIVAVRSYYENGALMRRSPYTLDGDHSGEDRRAHPTGELLSKGAYIKGMPQGEHTFLDPSGKPYGTNLILDGFGDWKSYHPTGGIEEEGRYRAGLKVDLWKTYYPSGGLKSELPYNETGSREGTYKSYYEDATLDSQGDFKRNLRDGTWQFYYKNGQRAVELGFEGGIRSGSWREWYWLSTLKSEGQFINNKRAGEWSEYHNNGHLKEKGLFKQDKKEGDWSQNWYSGSYWRKIKYSKGNSEDEDQRKCGQLKGRWEADLKGRKVGCQVCRVTFDSPPRQVKVGQWRWWHPNGKLETQAFFEEDLPHGSWSRFDEQERLIVKGRYHHGNKQGVWRGFYPHGANQYAGVFKGEGIEDGVWYTYHRDGSIESLGRYINGQRRDVWLWTHPQGGIGQLGSYIPSPKKEEADPKKEEADPKKEEADPKKDASTAKRPSLRHGVWISWHPNTRIREIGRYKEGRRDGVWRWWRASGEGWRSAWYGAGKVRVPLPAPAPISTEAQESLKTFYEGALSLIPPPPAAWSKTFLPKSIDAVPDSLFPILSESLILTLKTLKLNRAQTER